MTNKEDFDYFVEQLHENAAKEFQATEQFTLLRERLEQMDRDCDTMLTKDQKGFALECFDLIAETDGQQEHFVYQKGLTDSVKLLKWLGVLA